MCVRHDLHSENNAYNQIRALGNKKRTIIIVEQPDALPEG